jgi:hypothetical protein
MDPEDVDRFGTQRAAEIGAPLLHEAVTRLGLDAVADNALCARVLADLATRMFAAGYTFGVTETTAGFIEQLPPRIKLKTDVVDRELPEPGPLGEGPDWDGFTLG